MSEDFVSLHTHSDFSALDGLGKVSEYIAAAKERGAPAIAFTDHGSMRGLVQHHEKCEKAGIKPIFGVELYVAPDMRRKGLTDEEKKEIAKGLPKTKHKEAQKEYEESIGLRDRWHLTAWAESQEGLQNLYRLTSAAWIEGFYYYPRVDLQELIKYGDGLMISSGCLASPIHDQWRQGKKRASMDFADALYESFGDRFWLEVQPHAIADQRDANAHILKLRDRYKGSKLLATQDSHYVKKEDAPHHDVLLCIGTNKNINDTDRFRFDGDEFFFKTRKQMWQSYRRNHEYIPSQLVKEALDSTMEFADRCTAKVEIDYKKALLPDPGVPAKYKGNAFGFLKDLCFEGWKWRQINKRAIYYAGEHGLDASAGHELYRSRLLYELKELKRQRFERYFLIVRDIYREARERQILPGPGRGSVGGSLIAYLLGITAVDPIQHGLLFERFMNPDRKDLPDIDCDFSHDRREELITYMRDKYGEENVSQISTVGRLKGKQVFRDVSRVLGVPLVEVNKVASSIIDRPKHDEHEFDCIRDSFAEFDVCKEFNKKFPDVYHYATKIEGTAKTLGIHAAGVIASPVPLRDLVPLEARKSIGSDQRTIVTAVDMEDAAKLGLVKLDFLGLKTLTVISRCLKKIKERHGVDLDLESQDFNIEDKKVLQGFTDHDYVGVFQYDSASSDQICKGVKFERFEDIATMTALNRPGASKSGMDEKFRERKANPALREKHDFHEKISELCGDTLGTFVYQEHAIKIFRAAGFTPGEADSLRKAIGKKLAKEEINKHRERFVDGAVKHIGMDEEAAGRLMDVLVASSSYLFNKSHATEYGLIAYWTMWLKVYYPLEFFWACLVCEEDTAKITDFAREAKRRDIEVLPPHVNTSKKEFSIDDDAIRGSLVGIKGVGEGAASDIMAKAPFADFIDFIHRIDRRRCNRGAVQALAKAGAFGDMVNLRWLIGEGKAPGAIDDLWKGVQKKKLDLDALRKEVRSGFKAEEFSEEDLALIRADVSPVSFGTHPLDAYKTFLKREIRVRTELMEGEDYFEKFDETGHFVLGMIKVVKKSQVGDFGDVEADDPDFGKPMAKVNLEDRSGTERRVQFHHYVYGQNAVAIEAGVGKPLLVHCTALKEWSSIRGHFAVDVARMRQKLKTGEELTVWEQIARGEHPARLHPWKDDKVKEERIQNLRFNKSKDGGHFCGVVTHVQEKRDRRGQKMANFGLLDAVGHYIRVIAFASFWGDIAHVINPGAFISVEIEKQIRHGETSFLFNGGRVRIFKKTHR